MNIYGLDLTNLSACTYCKKMLRKSFERLGAISDKWKKFISEGVLVQNAAQLRAAEILDMFYDRIKDHKSDSNFVQLYKRIDFSRDPLKNCSFEPTSQEEERVANYTRRLAQQNKLLLHQRHLNVSFSPSNLGIEKSDVSEHFEIPEKKPVVRVQKENEMKIVQASDDSINESLGVYLVGGVGRGKTMLMNMLFEKLVAFRGEKEKNRLKRMHFFELMKSIHSQMSHSDIEKIANKMSDSIDILCLDEVAVTDVQDASIFPSILKVFSIRRVALVLTSNLHPNDLYSDGLNRHVFLPPLLNQLKKGCRIVSLNDEENRDFRKFGEKKFFPSEISKKDENDSILVEIPLSETRKLFIPVLPQTRVVVSEIERLIDSDLSESDFVTFANFLTIEKLSIEMHIKEKFKPLDILGPGRRFTKLIEVLYDKNIPFRIVSNGFDPLEIFDDLVVASESEFFPFNDSKASPLSSSAVKEAILALDRCKSRLSLHSSRLR